MYECICEALGRTGEYGIYKSSVRTFHLINGAKDRNAGEERETT
jgi:hypothetical protein